MQSDARRSVSRSEFSRNEHGRLSVNAPETWPESTTLQKKLWDTAVFLRNMYVFWGFFFKHSVTAGLRHKRRTPEEVKSLEG